MMHQRIDLPKRLGRRPSRGSVIQKDEIISLKIDLQVLSPQELIDKYFSAVHQVPDHHGERKRRGSSAKGNKK